MSNSIRPNNSSNDENSNYSTNSIIFSGYLEKKKLYTSSYKKRFVLLTSNSLHWFKKNPALPPTPPTSSTGLPPTPNTNNDKNPSQLKDYLGEERGQLSLWSITKVNYSQADPFSYHQSLYFDITCNQNKKRIFRASTPEEAKSWVNHINEAIKALNSLSTHKKFLSSSSEMAATTQPTISQPTHHIKLKIEKIALNLTNHTEIILAKSLEFNHIISLNNLFPLLNFTFSDHIQISSLVISFNDNTSYVLTLLDLLVLMKKLLKYRLKLILNHSISLKIPSDNIDLSLHSHHSKSPKENISKTTDVSESDDEHNTFSYSNSSYNYFPFSSISPIEETKEMNSSSTQISNLNFEISYSNDLCYVEIFSKTSNNSVKLALYPQLTNKNNLFLNNNTDDIKNLINLMDRLILSCKFHYQYLSYSQDTQDNSNLTSSISKFFKNIPIMTFRYFYYLKCLLLSILKLSLVNRSYCLHLILSFLILILALSNFLRNSLFPSSSTPTADTASSTTIVQSFLLNFETKKFSLFESELNFFLFLSLFLIFYNMFFIYQNLKPSLNYLLFSSPHDDFLSLLLVVHECSNSSTSTKSPNQHQSPQTAKTFASILDSNNQNDANNEEPELTVYSPEKISKRYIIGCNNDMKEASKRWKNTLEWRQQENIDNILYEPQPYFFLIKNMYPHYHAGRGRKGHVVFYERPGEFQASQLVGRGIKLEHLIRHWIFITEYQWKILAHNHDDAKGISIIDIAGIKMSDIGGDNMNYLKKTLSIAGQHYPERSYVIFIINAPSFFSFIWRIVKPLVNENTQKKIKILSAKDTLNGLLEHIDISQIPKYYGGKLDYPEDEDLNEPSQSTRSNSTFYYTRGRDPKDSVRFNCTESRDLEEYVLKINNGEIDKDSNSNKDCKLINFLNLIKLYLY